MKCAREESLQRRRIEQEIYEGEVSGRNGKMSAEKHLGLLYVSKLRTFLTWYSQSCHFDWVDSLGKELASVMVVIQMSLCTGACVCHFWLTNARMLFHPPECVTPQLV